MSKLGLSLAAFLLSVFVAIVDLFRGGITQSFLHESNTDHLIGLGILWLVPITFTILYYFLFQKIKVLAIKRFAARRLSVLFLVSTPGFLILTGLSLYYKAYLIVPICGLISMWGILWLTLPPRK